MNNRLVNFTVASCALLLLVACGGGSSGPKPQNTAEAPTRAGTTNLRFDNTDFTQVEVGNSFALIVQYGDRFAVEVSIDAEYADLVTVRQDGVRLAIGFDPSFRGDIRAEVADGIITLPLLEILEVRNSALVDVAGFSQSYLQVLQSGSSRVEVNNSSFDFLDATLRDSTQLQTSGVAPMPAANVVTSGNSQATLRMMDGGTLTVVAHGTANVGYFGDDVALNADTHGQATVTWLGSN